MRQPVLVVCRRVYARGGHLVTWSEWASRHARFRAGNNQDFSKGPVLKQWPNRLSPEAMLVGPSSKSEPDLQPESDVPAVARC